MGDRAVAMRREGRFRRFLPGAVRRWRREPEPSRRGSAGRRAGIRSGAGRGLLLALLVGSLAGAADLCAAARPAEAGRCDGAEGGSGLGTGRACAQTDPRTWLLRPPRPPVHAPFALEGSWEGRIVEDGRPVDVRITLQPDGVYLREAITGDGRKIQVTGTYRMSASTATAGFLTFLPVSWKPAEFCTGTLCLPLDILPSVTPYTMPDGDTLQVDDGALHRSP